MKRALIVLAAFALGTVPTGIAHATDITYVTPPSYCSIWAWDGPNHWYNAAATCEAPLQANNKMFRVSVTIMDGVFADIRRGPWRDCNLTSSLLSDLGNEWYGPNWEEAVVRVDIADDTKPGGC